VLCGAEELLISQPELVKAAFPVLAGHPPIIKDAGLEQQRNAQWR
jgi:hypothetical protein